MLVQAHKPVTAIVFLFDSRWLVSGSVDETIRFWEVDMGTMLIRTLTGHDDWVPTVAFSRDDKYVASGSRDGEIRIWNVEQGGTMHNSRVLGEHDSEIDSVMFSSNDEHLISGSDDRKVVIWNVHSGVLIAGLFYYYLRYFYTIPILIDGKYIIAGTGDD